MVPSDLRKLDAVRQRNLSTFYMCVKLAKANPTAFRFKIVLAQNTHRMGKNQYTFGLQFNKNLLHQRIRCCCLYIVKQLSPNGRPAIQCYSFQQCVFSAKNISVHGCLQQNNVCLFGMTSQWSSLIEGDVQLDWPIFHAVQPHVRIQMAKSFPTVARKVAT